MRYPQGSPTLRLLGRLLDPPESGRERPSPIQDQDPQVYSFPDSQGMGARTMSPYRLVFARFVFRLTLATLASAAAYVGVLV